MLMIRLEKHVNICIMKFRSLFENEALVKVFGREHPGYVCGMGLGVTPSQIIGSKSYSTGSGSSSDVAKIQKMQSEIDMLKAQVAEVDVLKEQLTFHMQHVKSNKVTDLESPINARPSSESSHRLKQHATLSRGTM
ncbi:hypothetical protein SESBI_08707 [Sesbania bispinosa]|nr:hypothetical protein SESBI_08707 [Sesbania bispinosa]